MPYAPKYTLDRNLTMDASTHHVPKEDTIYIILTILVSKFRTYVGYIKIIYFNLKLNKTLQSIKTRTFYKMCKKT